MSPWDRDAFSPQCSLVKELQGFHQSSPGKPLNENENLGRDKGKLWGAHLRILERSLFDILHNATTNQK